MKDPLLTSAHQCDMNDFKVTSNDICHSIVNSVTNDEDDWVESRKNSGHSIMNSVRTDEDEWIEPRNSDRHVPVLTQYHPRNYQSAFSKHETVTNRPKHTESTIPSKPSVSMLESKPFENDYFDKESFLVRYEHMIMEQEKEKMSTISHLQFFLDLLIDLQLDGQNIGDRHQRFDENKGNCLLIEFSIEEIKQAQKKLIHSGKYDAIKVDKQFLMVLDILCEDHNPVDGYSCEKKENKISWAEIVQCYRNCVVGMQTLEIIGRNSSIRNRTKERTIALLSGYRESSFINYSPSIRVLSGTNDLVNSNKTYDRSGVNSSKVDQGTYQEIKLRGLLNHPFVSFFTGATILAILLYECSSTIQSMTHYKHYFFERQTLDVKCPIGVNETFYHMGGELKLFEEHRGNFSTEKLVAEKMNAPQDLVDMGPTDGDNNLFKRKSFITTKSHVVPSIVKAALPFYH